MFREATPDQEIAALSQIDCICDDFEREWAAGSRPRIEDYLQRASDDTEAALLETLVMLDVEYRRQTGDTVNINDYAERFPAYRELVRHAVQSILLDRSAVRSNVRPFPADLPRHVDHFELLEIVGRGAAGTVFRGRDTKLNRIVAIKFANAAIANRDELVRFKREASNAVRVEHPGVVRVFSVGSLGDQPYIVSEFVDGPTLAKAIDNAATPPSPDAIVRLFLDLLDALDHAHRCGVIHRDLKPSNVLLSSRPNAASGHSFELSNYQPRIADFGHARCMESDTLFTLDGAILGTPAYMSPEQATGKARLADPRTDIYSIGTMLYQLLSGRLPFTGDTFEVIHKIGGMEPPELRGVNAGVDRVLAAICHKCLEKNPDCRYQSARALREDLQCWLDGRRTHARPATKQQKIRRSLIAKRYALVVGVLVLFSALAVFIGVHQHRSAKAAKRLLHAQLIAELLSSRGREVQSAVKNIQSELAAIVSLLTAELERTHDLGPRGRCLLRLAIVKQAPEVATELIEGVVAFDVDELGFVREELSRLSESQALLKNRLVAEGLDAAELLRLACLYGELHSDDLSATATERVVAALVRVPEGELQTWLDLLAPSADTFIPALWDRFYHGETVDEQDAACAALDTFLEHDSDDFAKLVADASETQLDDVLNNLSRETVPVHPISKRLSYEIEIVGAVENAVVEGRIANLAAALALAGNVDHLTRIVGDPANPELRSALINNFAKRNVSLKPLIKRLSRKSNELTKYGLILVIDACLEGRGKPLPPTFFVWLRENYREHSSSVVHCAAEWVLRKHDDLDWLAQTDQELIAEGRQPSRNWFLTEQGHCMIVMRGPHQFLMGTSVAPIRDAPAHQRDIERTFAVSAKLITVEQYNESVAPRERLQMAGEMPAHVDFYQAAEYCNWLSKLEQIEPTAYPDDMKTQGGEAGSLRYSQAYRMPTEAEYEFVARAGTTTRHCFGDSARFLTAYCYCGKSTVEEPQPPGQLRPNALGAFDVYGNLPQWCQDVYGAYPVETTIDSDGFVPSKQSRVVRGGHFRTPAREITSHQRAFVVPATGPQMIGFRLARTLKNE